MQDDFELDIGNTIINKNFRDNFVDSVTFSGHSCEFKIFSCLTTLASSFLLAAVEPADDKPNTATTLARGTPTTIPMPLSEVAKEAEERKAARELLLMTETWTTECAFSYLLATW